MRLALLCTIALLAPGLAFAQQQFCAIDGQGQPAAAPPAAAPPAQVVPAGNTDRNVYPVIGKDEIARSPALSRIAKNGATLLDLGTEDGIRIVFAYLNDSMEVFHVSPSGRYAVRSGRLMDMAEPDPSKRDLTFRRASIIPGVLPTVEMRGQNQGGAQEVAQAAPQAQDGNAVLAQLEKASFGIAGRPDAPRIYAFIDPLCSFSVRMIEALRPHIAAGRIQVAIVPLALIDHETNGRSTPAAQTLLSQPETMDTAWRGIVDGVRAKRPDAFAPTEEGRARLAANMTLAASLHVQATPTLVWRQVDGTPRAQMGGQDLDQVVASLTGAQR